MYRDDYLLRMIAQLGAVIRHILGLYRGGRSPLARIAIDEAYRDRLGVGSERLAELSDREILALVRFSGDGDGWRAEGAYIAALLAAEAAILRDEGEADAAAERALRALQLLVECALGAPEPLPEYAPAYADLLALLRDYDLPAQTLAGLIVLCEQAGDLARGEDLIHQLIDRAPAGWLSAGLAFYQRALARSDAELLAGGLPRDEVLAGLSELERRQDRP